VQLLAERKPQPAGREPARKCVERRGAEASATSSMLRLRTRFLVATSRSCESFRHGFGPRRRQWTGTARQAGLAGSGSAAPELAAKVPFDEWLEVVFPLAKFPASSLYLEPGEHLGEYLNTDKDTGCVMDDPVRTRAHPLIGFDVEKASELIIKSALSKVVRRGNPVFAIAVALGAAKAASRRRFAATSSAATRCCQWPLHSTTCGALQQQLFTILSYV